MLWGVAVGTTAAIFFGLGTLCGKLIRRTEDKYSDQKTTIAGNYSLNRVPSHLVNTTEKLLSPASSLSPEKLNDKDIYSEVHNPVMLYAIAQIKSENTQSVNQQLPSPYASTVAVNPINQTSYNSSETVLMGAGAPSESGYITDLTVNNE